MIDVQHGEQPLKRVAAARRTREPTLDPTDPDATDDDNAGTALYAPHQTSLYVAPPVVSGRIPKNVYGNLDVYVPSMVPPGGTHIPHPETARAARTVGIDYADAVTGFSFKGRHGTAVTNGAVVAAEYREAVEEVIKAFEDERVKAEEERRSLAALKMWKRFLAGLRIRERIEGYDIEGERDTAGRYELEKAEDEDEDEYEGGGFLPDRDADESAQPTAKTMPMRSLPDLANEDLSGGFLADEDEQEAMEAPHASDRFVNMVNDDDDDDDGGGFLFDRVDEDAEEAMQEINEDKDGDTNYEETKRSAGKASADDDGQEILHQGGGFLPDNDHTRNKTPPTNESIKHSNPEGGMQDNYSSIDPCNTPPNIERVKETFSDLPAGELEEAKMLQQLYESQKVEDSPVSKEGVAAPTPSKSPGPPPTRGAIAGGEEGIFAHPSEAYQSNEPVVEARGHPEPDSSEEDKGSLLSHDPDDEDADPEWLA